MDMLPTSEILRMLTRRELFSRVGTGIGSVALGSLLAEDSPLFAGTSAGHGPSAGRPLAARMTDVAPRAKNVIFLHMVGAPSHLDLFDFKPELVRRHGQPMPDDLWEGLRLAFIRKQPNLFGSPFRFHKHGESGLELPELLPHLGAVADELCMIKSLHTEHFNHGPAQLFFHTGFERFGAAFVGILGGLRIGE